MKRQVRLRDQDRAGQVAGDVLVKVQPGVGGPRERAVAGDVVGVLVRVDYAHDRMAALALQVDGWPHVKRGSTTSAFRD